MEANIATNNKDPLYIDPNFVRSVDAYLDELSELSSSANDRNVFYRHLVDRLLPITRAERVMIGLHNESTISAMYSAVSQDGLPCDPAIELYAIEISDCIKHSRSKSYELNNEVCFIVPFNADHTSQFLLITCSANLPELRRVFLDLAEAVAEIATKFENYLSISDSQKKFSRLESYVQFLNHAHSSLELEEVAHHIVNGSRQLLDADRVWLFDGGKRQRPICCSGVSQINQQSKSVLQLKNLVASCSKLNSEFRWYADETNTNNPLA
ncbi:MAG: hypothetical protein AAGA30_11575, partial [Planctomycetota bacterium]